MGAEPNLAGSARYFEQRFPFSAIKRVLITEQENSLPNIVLV